MARVILALLATLLPCLAQTQPDGQFREAGVCARCHVISVVEWGMSGHRKAATGCAACHGASQGHVIDERNNVKPERLPHGEAIATLCAECHQAGCPKTKHRGGCQTCHHVHALVDPKKPAAAAGDPAMDRLAASWERFGKLMEDGRRLAAAGQWEAARGAFRNALEQKPGDGEAAARLKTCERRLRKAWPGFEIGGAEFDAATGLPREVRVAGAEIAMVLVPGGDIDIGSERWAASRPVHTVRVPPFYLAKYELTQAQWKALMGTNPSAHQETAEAARMPVEQVSWRDCRALVAKLNGTVAGGGFRLPTEAEWEFAARAGGGWSAAEPAQAPRPVGGGKANRLGLYDMQGNVWEWCASLYRPYPYAADDGREDPEAPGLRVLRGGGYADPGGWYDAGARHGDRPDRKLRWYGVRLARSVPE